jgi:membrane fusion protein
MHEPHGSELAKGDEMAPRTVEPLFRPQVLGQHQTQWLGTVLVRPAPSHRVFTLFAVLAAAGILALLFFASYARKAHVSGWLVPEQGMVKVYVSQPGVVSSIFVKDGETVSLGQPLLALSTEQQSAALGNTQANIARGIAARRDSLVDEERQNQKLFRQQSQALQDRLAALKLELAQIREEIGIQQSRVQLANQSEQRQRGLIERGFISAQQLQGAVEARLEQAAKLRNLERNRMTLQRDYMTLEADLRDLPLKFHAQSANIERNISAMGQELAEAEVRREIIVPAPQSGAVTAIQAEIGGGVKSAVPVLSILPAGTKLEAHLYAPSRAIGFLQVGQKVLLRYQAYPYQKFGHYEGVVSSISGSATSPAELPSQLAGLTSLFGPTEPVYRITVAPARQEVTAYGKPVRLQPGMQLDADIVIERRQLIEWVLDPLYSFTGKWNG